jgi:hypothetical protein
MQPVTSPHSRYHYSNGLDEEKDTTDNQTKKTNTNTNTNLKQEIPNQVGAKETSKKESK